MFRLIVFDLDGTLVDSRRDIAESANALLEFCGAAPLAEDRIGRMVGDGAARLVARAFAAAEWPPPPNALERFLTIYNSRLLQHTRPYPGIPGALDALGSQARLAVLTNKPLAATRQILAGLDLARHFSDEAVVAGDGPFPRKPDPAGLRHLSSTAGVPLTDTLLVGDSLIDWHTAQQAPSAICLARYGFGFAGFPEGDLRPGDRVIDTPKELKGLMDL